MKTAHNHASELVNRLRLRESPVDGNGDLDEARDVEEATRMIADYIEQNFIGELMQLEYLLAEKSTGGAFLEIKRGMDVKGMLATAERELSLRRRCYPEWVRIGKMSQSLADRELARMGEIVSLLQDAWAEVNPENKQTSLL